ncbi:centriolar protein [Chloropicon roscoffensis]|uniref:Centriolar protein n=1 Tax=Chloropicon roscoffensis TaxID=1461544 RepID=A0AAX4P5K0_9CHLO
MREGDKVFRGHKDSVTSLCWSAHGHQVVTGSLDATAILWNADTAESLVVLEGHGKGIYSVDWSRDGNFVSTASTDCSARLWDVGSGLELHSYAPEVRSIVWSTSFTRTGEALLAGYADGKARLWHVEEGTILRTLEGHASWVVGCKCSPVDDHRFATASKDGSAAIWDGRDQQLGTCIASKVPLTCLDWSPDGNLLVTGSKDCRLRVWDTRKLGHGQIFDLQTELSPMSYEVTSCSWSALGPYVAATCADEIVTVYDAGTGKKIRKFQGHQGTVTCSQWAPDGLYLASGSSDKSAKLWGTEGMRLEEGALASEEEESGSPTTLSYLGVARKSSFDASYLMGMRMNPGAQAQGAAADPMAAAADQRGSPRAQGLRGQGEDSDDSGGSEDAEVCLLKDGSRIVILDDELDLPEQRDGSRRNSFSFSKGATNVDQLEEFRLPLGNSERYGETYLARQTMHAFGAGGKRAQWVLREQGVVEMERGVTHCAVSHDGERIAATLKNRTIVVLRRDGRGQYAKDLTLQSLKVLPTCFAFACKAHHEGCSGHSDGKVIAWNLQEGRREFTLHGHRTNVSCVMYHPSNPHLLVSASHDCSCVVWDLDLKQPIHTLEEHSGYIRHAGWSPCGDYVCTASSDNSARLWMGQSGRRTQTLRGSTNTLYCCCWSPDSNRVAAASRDGSIRVYSRAGEDALVVMAGHRSEVRSLAWHPSGDVLCAGCWDGKVSFWNPSTGERLYTCQLHVGAVKSLEFVSEGRSLVTASLDATVKVFRLSAVRSDAEHAKRCEHVCSQNKRNMGELLALCAGGSGVEESLARQVVQQALEGVREAVRGLGAASSHGAGVEAYAKVGEGLDAAILGLRMAGDEHKATGDQS